MDPKIYREVIKLLVELNRRGKTIIIVYHLLHGLPDYARLLVLKSGEIVFDGKIADVKAIRKIKVIAKKDSYESEYLVDEEDINNFVAKLRLQGYEEILLSEPDIYDLVRTLI